ncbi:MAG: ATP synthase F1 subunit delta [Bacilli bacterium]|jgi:F-type H+-transporting ATPase subunit delta
MTNTPALMYAQAIHSLAVEENEVEKIKKIVNDFDVELMREPKLLDLLMTPSIQNEEKEKVVRTITKPYESNLFTNTILLLTKQRRISIYPEIAKEFNKLADETLQIKHGLVYSVNELDEKTLARIEESISKSIGFTVKLTNVIEPSIIGGIKVIVGDKIFDRTVTSQIDELKEVLKKRKGVL